MQIVNSSTRSYRFYFIDRAGLIAKALDVESFSDAEACELAGMMLAEQSTYPGIEVWDRARRVQRLPAPPMRDNRLYRTTAQQLRGMAKDNGLPLRDQLLALSHDIDEYADRLEASGPA